MNKLGTRTPTEQLVHKLRLMADAGGNITRDRMRITIESADRLEELEQQLLSMSATCRELAHEINTLKGGDDDEEH